MMEEVVDPRQRGARGRSRYGCHMFQRALPVLLLLSCSAPVKGERLLELRTSPTTDVDTIKGLLTLTAVATTEAGGIGSGTVRFTSDVGHFSVEEVALDEFGKAETIFSCVAGTHPFCDTLGPPTSPFSGTGPRTTASRRIPLRRSAAAHAHVLW